MAIGLLPGLVVPNELAMEVNGFFIRRLALNADVRLLLIGVSVTDTGGGSATTRLMGGGDGGVIRNERRSLACLKKALPLTRPNVLLLYKLFLFMLLLLL